MVLVQKWLFFLFFILGNIGQENVFHHIVEGKNAFLGYQNMNFRNSKNRQFSKGVSAWFWSKIGHFPSFYFRQYRPGKCGLRYSRRKKRLSRLIKTRSLKSRKIEIFPKGLVHCFGPKTGYFSIFLF